MITPYIPLKMILYIHSTFNLPGLLITQYSTYQRLLLYRFFVCLLSWKIILMHIVYLLSYSSPMRMKHHTAVILLLEWNVYIFVLSFCFIFHSTQIALHFDWGVQDIRNLEEKENKNKSLELLKAHSLSLKIKSIKPYLITTNLDECGFSHDSKVFKNRDAVFVC